MIKSLQNDNKHTDKRDPKKAQTICRRDHVEYTQTDIIEFLICNSTRQTIGQVNRETSQPIGVFVISLRKLMALWLA